MAPTTRVIADISQGDKWNTAEWHIVELDRCATDMMMAVANSYAYLVGEGLSRGNR